MYTPVSDDSAEGKLGRNVLTVNPTTVCGSDFFWDALARDAHGPLRLPVIAPTSGSYFDLTAGG